MKCPNGCGDTTVLKKMPSIYSLIPWADIESLIGAKDEVFLKALYIHDVCQECGFVGGLDLFEDRPQLITVGEAEVPKT